MILYDVCIILLIMLLYVVLPGLPLAILFLKDSAWGERFAVSSIFGSVQFYIIYFILKNGITELYISTIFFVMFMFVVPLLLLFKDGEKRFSFRFR